jgi:hypothetical protein
MKNRTRLLTGLTAGTMALGAMCFGFSSWSTDITVSGKVSANGSWNVAVTDAAVSKLSTGAKVNNSSVYNSFANDELYTKSQYEATTAMNAKIAELEEAGYKNVEGEAVAYKIYAYISYYPDANDKTNFVSTEVIGVYETTAEADEAATAKKDEIVAAGGSVNSRGRARAYGYEITYTAADESTASFDDTSATYVPVEFTVGGAWAEYSVTVTNNGTADADLSDYKLETELTAPYSVELPEIADGEILKAGESCNLTFVVSVSDSEDDFTADAQEFKVSLKYVQPEIEDAPAASHTHG